MTGLRGENPFQTEYSSDENDIAAEFINPCLRASNRYDRITGFFASSVFLLMFAALHDFILSNEGHIRVLCSPRVSFSDAEQIECGYQTRSDLSLHEQLNDELHRLLASDDLAQPARLLAVLIASGRLDLRIAEVAKRADGGMKRMFHDKVGLFRDRSGDGVGFRGSMNETFLGLSPSGNIESVDVWPSWIDGRDAIRFENASRRFEVIWNGQAHGVSVTRLPSETIAALQAVAEETTLEGALAAIQPAIQVVDPTPDQVGPFKLRAHQRDALASWRSNGHRGIFRHATGAGKTVSGLRAMVESMDAGLVPIVIVPSVELLRQWSAQVVDVLGAPTILCGGGYTRWREKNLVRAAVAGRTRHCILAIDATARSPSFLAQLYGFDHRLFLLFDEVHNAGAAENKRSLAEIDAIWRLGLSATPERAGDEEGTDFIFDYFGGVIHEYNLDDAIHDGVLVPYTYHPFFVHLTGEEQEGWDEVSAEIARLTAIVHEPNPPGWVESRLDLLRIQRARIAKAAAGKIPKAVDLVKQRFVPGSDQKWLIYCEGLEQLRELRSALRVEGIKSWEFHSQMQGDREATLEVFADSGGVIVAIKCLDEGVDIPAASDALILASSRNPREFIQRRGRVLRRAQNKSLARIYDAIVLPASGSPRSSTNALVVGELARAMSFSRSSLGTSAATVLENKWDELGYEMEEIEALANVGFEPGESHAETP